MNVEGRQFVPVPFTVEEGEDSEKQYLALQVCGSFDRETKKCKDYENRPAVCRRYFCQGKPHPQVLDLKGTLKILRRVT